MIRVISGACKGRRLKTVASPLVRPMPDKLKSALFNIIGETVPGAVVLDGFAGTGSIGIEALSRGARSAVFIEELPAALRVLRDNIDHCGLRESAVVVAWEFNRAVIKLAKEGVRFDLIFLDPPYRLLDERNPLKVIRKRGVLKPGGLLVLRHHRKTEPRSGDFPVRRAVTLGDDTMTFYVNEPDREPTPTPSGGQAAGPGARLRTGGGSFTMSAPPKGKIPVDR